MNNWSVCDENKRPRVWAPDFYLIPFEKYIEVCGSKIFDYYYRQRIFNHNGYLVTFFHIYKVTNKWKKHLLNYPQLFTLFRNHKLYEILDK